ncbi:hypothetical protein KR032_001731 [Drosophila birchii]|nr:hypothetical protein KR032_001731 [Drosophila birchii]
MRIDLKALLLISTSAAPDSVVRMSNRFQVGKASYIVRYELRRSELIICQMKRVRFSSNPASRPKKRQRRQQRKLESGITRVESSSQTLQNQNSIALVTTASQTPRRESSTIQMDTSDLFPTFAKEQQTASCEMLSSGSQTDEQTLLNRTTQANISTKSWSTQTRIRSASLGSQTEYTFNNVGVQTKIGGNHETTQTDEIGEQLIQPYLQALMLESIKNVSNLISNEVISAVSQVLDIRGFEVKKTAQEQDLPREGALEPLTPLPVDQFGIKLSSEKILSVDGIKGLLSMTNLKTSSSQSTQTEEKEKDKESLMAKVSADMATQTEKLEKERSRWTLKRI